MLNIHYEKKIKAGGEQLKTVVALVLVGWFLPSKWRVRRSLVHLGAGISGFVRKLVKDRSIDFLHTSGE